MPEVDKRDTNAHLHVGGSDIGVQVLLSQAEAQQIYGDAAVAGWYTFATLAGGSIGNDVDFERDRDEAGNFTGKIVINQEDWVLSNTIKEDADEVFYLLRDVLANTAHRFRYALPAGTKTVDVDGTGTTAEHDVHVLYGLYNGQVSPDWEYPTEAGQKRERDIEIRGTKTDANPAYVRKTVWLGDDTTWQYATGDDLSDFKDAATP